MKRTHSRATLLKKRVRKIQKRAKFVGFLYLLGTIALAAIAALFPLIVGTCIAADETAMPVLTFYQPVLDMLASEEGFVLTAKNFTNLLAVVLFAAMLLTLIVNVIRSFANLGWLFKRRASYSYGFNRNMHAMDDMAKRFSNSLYTMIMINLFICLLSGGLAAEDEEGVMVTLFAYIALAVGLVFHFICGLIGGKVTLFLLSTNNRVEEETRENGLFMFFVRNLIQIAIVLVIISMLMKESVFLATVQQIGQFLSDMLAGEEELALDVMALLPGVVEVVAWLFIAVLAGHAFAPTEFNREGIIGSGMRNFAIFSFLTTIMIVAVAIMPMLFAEEGEEVALNMNLILAAVVAFVGFVLDCAVRPREHWDYDYDEVDVEAYFQNGEQRYSYRSEEQRYNYHTDDQRYRYPII